MKAMGIIFANIYDSSLGELTNKRTIASLPYGGRYRQIDFTLSNMSNSGIRHIGIITKYNYQSLMNHIGSGQEWDLELEEGGLEYLTPFAMGHNGSYRGKVEALNSAMIFLENALEDYVVLADSNVLCNIDLDRVLEQHVESGKDVTVAVKAGIANGSKQLDLGIRLDKKGQVSDMAVDYCAGPDYLASMGIFVISRELLIYFVKESVARSRYRFERDFLLKQFNDKNLTVGVYNFDGVAMFNESTQEYYRNNLALIDFDTRHGLFRTDRNIYTKVRDRVPATYGENSQIDDCIVADGCQLDGIADHSVFFRQVRLDAGAEVKECVIMNDCSIGAGAELYCAILDKDVVVRPGVRLIGTPENPIVVKRGEIV